MQPEASDAGYLWDMLESAQSVRGMIEGKLFAQYSADRKTRRAVEREFEITGGAAWKVSQEFREAHPEGVAILGGWGQFVLPDFKCIGPRQLVCLCFCEGAVRSTGGQAARGTRPTRCQEKWPHPHPEIPWRKIIAQRHKLAHEHAEILDEMVWRVAAAHVPELIDCLSPLVKAPPEGPSTNA